MRREMQRALEADGEKLRQLTGEDHGPWPLHPSAAWGIILEWLDAYAEEEATFSRYADHVILDGIMTAAQRRAMSALFPRGERLPKTASEKCQNCGQDLPLLHPCINDECPIPGSY